MKENGGLNSEDILDISSNVESLTLLKTAWGDSHEEETERGDKSVPGPEVAPWEQPVDNPILMYLREISKVSLLTANDEKA